MKVPLLLLMLSVVVSNAMADLYGYPATKTPSIKLVQALEISQQMISIAKIKGDYFVTSATIAGNREGDGRGYWNIWFSDGKGHTFATYIPTHESFCSLRVHDGSDDGIEYRFQREGFDVVKEPARLKKRDDSK